MKRALVTEFTEGDGTLAIETRVINGGVAYVWVDRTSDSIVSAFMRGEEDWHAGQVRRAA